MIVSNVINKMFNEYQNINSTVNSCLKYSFKYNGYKTDKMKQKICKKYDSELSNKILEFCGSTHTLRFTNEINKSKDISVLIN